MIEARSVWVVRGRIVILEDISFTVRPGEIAGIIGPNGAGKTTLLRTVLGLDRPTSGRILIMGQPVNRPGLSRTPVGYVPQRPPVDDRVPLSVRDVVAMGGVTAGVLGRRYPRSLGRRVEHCLEDVGLIHLRDRPFRELSGGERRRTLLARALVQNPGILLLDEPDAGLDPPAARRLFDVLESLRMSRPVAVIAVSHDLRAVASVADTLMCINRTVHVHGHPSEVLGSRGLQDAYRCEIDIVLAARGR